MMSTTARAGRTDSAKMCMESTILEAVRTAHTPMQSAGANAVCVRERQNAPRFAGADSELAWYQTTWVEWAAEEKQWHCCGDVTNGCNGTLEDQTFNAVAPNLWIAASTTSSAVESASSVSSQSRILGSTTSSAVESAGSVNSQSGTLGDGAAIGVGVGAAMGGMAVLGAALWLLKHYRKRKQFQRPGSPVLIAGEGGAGVTELNAQRVDAKPVDTVALLPYHSEMNAAQEPKELNGKQYSRELPA